MKHIFFFFFFFLLSSCSLFESSPQVAGETDRQIFQKRVNQVCLNSYGRGRFEFESQKYVFSFESQVEYGVQKWILSLDFPMQAEELLTIQWNRKSYRKMKLKGGFARRLVGGFIEYRKKHPDIDRAALKTFLRVTGNLIRSLSYTQNMGQLRCVDGKKQQYDKSLECSLTDRDTIYWDLNKDQLETYVTILKDYNVQFTASGLSDGKYSRITFMLNKKVFDQNKREFGLELFIKKCLPTAKN